MAIITISRGSYSRAKEIAEKLAHELGYGCISREILLEASEEFNIPEIKLARAIEDAPSILDRFTHGKERYLAYIRAALLKHAQKDNVVYHGIGGNFLLQGIPHVLKVRIIADLEDRVADEMKRESISVSEAREIIQKDDEERRRWALTLYGADPWDPMLYDLVIHLQTVTMNDAVSIIKHMVQLPSFQTTPQSQQLIDNLVLLARLQVETVWWESSPS
jgi:cytidylate kinase